MYEILRNYLENGTYIISDAQSRIDFGVARGKITATEAGVLLMVATEHAVAEANIVTTAELATRIEDAEAALMELAELVGGAE